MVKLSEVDPVDVIVDDDGDEDYIDEDDASEGDLHDAALSYDSDSHSEADSDSDPLDDESFLERLAALKDIIPPTTRSNVKHTVSSAASWTWGIGRFVGSAAWVVVTGALLVLLPVALELEKEAAILQQEAQAQKPYAAQQMLPGVQPGLPGAQPAAP